MARRPQRGTVEGRTEQFRLRIEYWRRTRQKRSPMPAKLWAGAAELAREAGVSYVARSLGVGYASLKEHLGPAGTASAGTADLVEFRAVPLPMPEAGLGHVLEVSRTDGSRLVVRLAPGCDFDVGALVCTFARPS